MAGSFFGMLGGLSARWHKPERPPVPPEDVKRHKENIARADLLQALQKHPGWEIFNKELCAIEQEIADRRATEDKAQFDKATAEAKLMRRIRNIVLDSIAEAEAASKILSSEPDTETTDDQD